MNWWRKCTVISGIEQRILTWRVMSASNWSLGNSWPWNKIALCSEWRKMWLHNPNWISGSGSPSKAWKRIIKDINVNRNTSWQIMKSFRSKMFRGDIPASLMFTFRNWRKIRIMDHLPIQRKSISDTVKHESFESNIMISNFNFKPCEKIREFFTSMQNWTPYARESIK